MKKLILIFISAIGAVGAQAQNINPEVDYVAGDNYKPTWTPRHRDSLFTGCAIDANLTGGALSQNITSNSPLTGYGNTLNSHYSSLKFNGGVSTGVDVEVDRFYGRGYHWGFGLGVMYMYQQGNVTMNNFHVEYQSLDNFGNTFRQLITADQPIKETIGVSNFNIPLLLKYKTRISTKVGLTADAGVLVNLQERNSYSTNASFDYEAIYKAGTNENGTSTWVYDNSPVPASTDVLLTKSQYLSTHSGADLQNYFNTLRSEGYNVGLGVNPQQGSGKINYNIGSVGFLFRPAVSIYLSERIALNLGLYYLYQGFTNNPSASNQITNKVGSYNSVLNSVTSVANSSYGVSAGIRYFVHQRKVTPVDVAPQTDDIVTVAPAPEPVLVPPPAPPVAPKKEEAVDDDDDAAISTPILFDLDKTALKPAAYPILDKAAKKADSDKDIYLEINGYTDITGTASFNLALSKKRAAIVKDYLKKKGVNPRQMKTIGHGAKSPAASNKTRAGRAKNRRVVMKVKQKGK